MGLNFEIRFWQAFLPLFLASSFVGYFLLIILIRTIVSGHQIKTAISGYRIFYLENPDLYYDITKYASVKTTPKPRSQFSRKIHSFCAIVREI